MFSKGQLIFGILFLLAFIAILIYTYRRDLKLHRRYYKGSIWALIVFIAFILFIVCMKFIFMR